MCKVGKIRILGKQTLEHGWLPGRYLAEKRWIVEEIPDTVDPLTTDHEAFIGVRKNFSNVLAE